MDRRLTLDAKLRKALGSNNVYFQPTTNTRLQYPCIIYQRDGASPMFADGQVYHHKTRYSVTVVSSDPDNEIRSKIEDFQLCSFARFYVADDLNHDVFDLFF